MKKKLTIRAVARLRSQFSVFASAHSEASKALKAVATVLGSSFVTNEDPDTQYVIWRTPVFKAVLALDLDEEILSLSFRDKANAAGFDAEGKTAQELVKDIRYNVTEFKPTKPMDPRVKTLRDKFATLEI